VVSVHELKMSETPTPTPTPMLTPAQADRSRTLAEAQFDKPNDEKSTLKNLARQHAIDAKLAENAGRVQAAKERGAARDDAWSARKDEIAANVGGTLRARSAELAAAPGFHEAGMVTGAVGSAAYNTGSAVGSAVQRAGSAVGSAVGSVTTTTTHEEKLNNAQNDEENANANLRVNIARRNAALAKQAANAQGWAAYRAEHPYTTAVWNRTSEGAETVGTSCWNQTRACCRSTYGASDWTRHRLLDERGDLVGNQTTWYQRLVGCFYKAPPYMATNKDKVGQQDEVDGRFETHTFASTETDNRVCVNGCTQPWCSGYLELLIILIIGVLMIPIACLAHYSGLIFLYQRYSNTLSFIGYMLGVASCSFTNQDTWLLAFIVFMMMPFGFVVLGAQLNAYTQASGNTGGNAAGYPDTTVPLTGTVPPNVGFTFLVLSYESSHGNDLWLFGLVFAIGVILMMVACGFWLIFAYMLFMQLYGSMKFVEIETPTNDLLYENEKDRPRRYQTYWLDWFGDTTANPRTSNTVVVGKNRTTVCCEWWRSTCGPNHEPGTLDYRLTRVRRCLFLVFLVGVACFIGLFGELITNIVGVSEDEANIGAASTFDGFDFLFCYEMGKYIVSPFPVTGGKDPYIALRFFGNPGMFAFDLALLTWGYIMFCVGSVYEPQQWLTAWVSNPGGYKQMAFATVNTTTAVYWIDDLHQTNNTKALNSYESFSYSWAALQEYKIWFFSLYFGARLLLFGVMVMSHNGRRLFGGCSRASCTKCCACCGSKEVHPNV